jgi:hypothetical protein
VRRAVRSGAVAICAILALGACAGSKNGDAGAPGSSASVTRPEDVIAPLTELKIKLPSLVTLGNQAATQASAGDWEAARDSYESLINLWFEVEGAVGDKDRDIYERSETAQGLISDGVDTRKAARVATGAADQAAAITTFLDTYAP